MKYSPRRFFSNAVSALALLIMTSGCGTIDTLGLIRYSGLQTMYKNNSQEPIGDFVSKTYAYNEYASTFTLSDGIRVFTFAGSHPVRVGENVGHYTGTYSEGSDSGTVFVGFEMGVHIYFHLVKDTSTYMAFDGNLK